MGATGQESCHQGSVSFAETLVNIYQTKQCSIPEDFLF
jgi:hypothetical protein